MIESARRATAGDLAVLTTLAETAVAELRPQRGGELWWRREARSGSAGEALAALLDEPDALVVVGTIDDVVVGYGIVRTEVLHDGTLLAVVDDLYVEPGAREIGVGELVMDELLAWATDRGCVGIDALALPGNRAAKNFFERFGLTARAIVVHRRLPAGEAPAEEPGA
ncbi:MAG: GNAT family N-acetyltransferase [Acidimicrobiales bacterium]